MNIFYRVCNRIIRCIVRGYLKEKGIQNGFILQVTTSGLINSWKNSNKKIKEKIWAVRRGFYPSRIDLYGLNNNNFKLYLSDLDYRKIFPLNNCFQTWIDNKLTTKFVLQDIRLKDFMPKYYLYIDNAGYYSYLMDFDENFTKDSNALLHLLQIEKALAVKPLGGSGGYGFMKLEYRNDEIIVNGKPISFNDFEVLKTNLKGYIVTEYCNQHSSLVKVWPKSECTLRIIIARILDEYGVGDSQAIVSYARFGTSISGSTSNLSQGGVGVPFDYESGIFGDNYYRYKKFDLAGQIQYNVHPDTHVAIHGTRIPNWDKVKKGLDDIVAYLSTLEYFGFDVIITEDSFKICEINSLPQIDYEQIMCGPMWTNEFAKRFFERKLAQKR
jgi:hypothetical protein